MDALYQIVPHFTARIIPAPTGPGFALRSRRGNMEVYNLFLEVAQIAFGRKIAEWIEGHGLASRRYFT
jgi:hypothetical protein